MGLAVGCGAESVFSLVVVDFFDGGVAAHHFFFDFVVAEGQSFEEFVGVG